MVRSSHREKQLTTPEHKRTKDFRIGLIIRSLRSIADVSHTPELRRTTKDGGTRPGERERERDERWYVIRMLRGRLCHCVALAPSPCAVCRIYHICHLSPLGELFSRSELIVESDKYQPRHRKIFLENVLIIFVQTDIRLNKDYQLIPDPGKSL